MELKWILAIAAEATFWVLFGAFLVLRYRYVRDDLSRALFVAIVVDNVVILGLGVWDFLETGRASTYTTAIGALLLYGLTFGKSDMKRLDAWAKRRLTPRSRVRPEARCEPSHPGR